jgi:hypothetical protein
MEALMAAGNESRTGTWRKRGLLTGPPQGLPWAHSHAALPTPTASDGRAADLYYSPRDAHGRAHVACARVEAAPGDGLQVVAHESEPVLSPGALGTFDDSGTTVSCVLDGDAGTLLYYTGWTRGVTVPFYFYVGLAQRPFGARRFERVSRAPLLERTAVDPFLTASPWVLRDDGVWRMWYVSCTGWEPSGDSAQPPRHHYHLRYAESADGVAWRRTGHVAVDFADEREHAISRPCVVREGDRYRMWFAARGESYRIGYAESRDGLRWDRDDDRATGLEPSRAGWDSEMMAYPTLLDVGDNRHMLYNGNGYGATGIGYATWEAGIAPGEALKIGDAVAGAARGASGEAVAR